jgi:hypothetical protein
MLSSSSRKMMAKARTRGKYYSLDDPMPFATNKMISLT